MRTFFLAIFFFTAISLYAQRECATTSYTEALLRSDKKSAVRLAEAEAFLLRQSRLMRETGDGSATSSSLIIIPVVVHIVYHSDAENISDAQVKSQLEALNRDFRRMNGDTLNTPERFRPLAADVQISFQLATADPGGRATTGIVRRKSPVTYWKNDDKIKFRAEGGDDAWDSRSYLNIWVGNMQSVMGYASVPGSPVEKDGLVISYHVFGTLNKSGAYDLGRTAVHEAGHWLGLKHIWGDQYCGDDGVDDTPRQGNFTPGCPTGFRSSCENNVTGDMYMNYMDYTGDACMNLFTEGQKSRMRAAVSAGGPRNSLLSSRGLQAPWVEGAPVEEEVITTSRLFPNPAHTQITLGTGDQWIGRTVYIRNLNGAVVHSVKIIAKWQPISLMGLRPGMYILQAENGPEKLQEKFIKL